MPEIPDAIYKFHKRGDHNVTYVIIASETGAVSYYQYQSVDGYWYMVKSTRTVAVVLYEFTMPVNTDASAGWTGRAGLSYTTLPLAFGE